ncbi:MAG: hypothetical protein ACI9DQ_001480, partial [Glaciecola sp.]
MHYFSDRLYRLLRTQILIYDIAIRRVYSVFLNSIGTLYFLV